MSLPASNPQAAGPKPLIWGDTARGPFGPACRYDIRAIERAITTDVSRLEPVARGMVRLFRFEPVRRDGDVTVPEWVRQDPGWQALAAASGRWFGESIKEVMWYCDEMLYAGDIPQLRIVDVSQDLAEECRLTNQPPEVQRFSKRLEQEFFLPREVADSATALRIALDGVRLNPQKTVRLPVIG